MAKVITFLSVDHSTISLESNDRLVKFSQAFPDRGFEAFATLKVKVNKKW